MKRYYFSKENEMKKTVLHKHHLALGAMMTEFAGYDMPLRYTSITEEHDFVRNKAGVFDVSHMGEFYINGEHATAFVDFIFTNDVTSMVNKQVLYGMMCYPGGGVVDDLLVYKVNDESYILVVNASNIEKDFAWVIKNNKFGCVVSNESDEISEIALQGPLAESILRTHTNYPVEQLAFFTFDYMMIEGKEVLVSRTGYTGEDGFEIYGSASDIETIFLALLKDRDDIVPCGLGARDTLRFEVALPLYGQELSKDITPLEAGLGFAVKLEAGDFIGKDELVKQKEEGLTRRITGLEMIDKGVLRHGYPVYHEDTLVGEVTTGYKSPSTGETVALAMIDKPYDKLGTMLEVDIRGKRKKVKVRKKRFYSKHYKKEETK
jgi:aminomethyltransferase